MAHIHLELKEYEEAIKKCEQALDIQKKIYGDDSKKT